MKLTDFEFRACQILLAAACAGVEFGEMKQAMREESIPERIWRSLYNELGLKVLVNGDDAEEYVFAPGNLVPFAPRTLAKCPLPEIRTGGSTA